MKARNVSLKILYDSKDISEGIEPFLKSFECKDNLSGVADDCTIKLEDRAELWESSWFPQRGATLSISILANNWDSAGDMELPLGIFEVDEVEISGLPHEVTIKAVSVPDNNTLRGIKRNRSWEKMKITDVAKNIADDASMELWHQIEDNPEIERLEQVEESDLAFLAKTSSNRGLGLKVSDKQINLFDIKSLDTAEPATTIKRDASRLLNYHFKVKTRDTYTACHVRYNNTKTGEFIEYTFDPEKASEESSDNGSNTTEETAVSDDYSEGGDEGADEAAESEENSDSCSEEYDGGRTKILEVHDKVESVADAERLAKKKLREKNQDAMTASMTFMGLAVTQDCNIWLAGYTVTVEGFHNFDGKYLITSASHSIGSGYTMKLEMRRCLNGY